MSLTVLFQDAMTNGVVYHESANPGDRRGDQINLDTWWHTPEDQKTLAQARRLCYPDPAKSDVVGIRRRATAVLTRLAKMVDITVKQPKRMKGSGAHTNPVQHAFFPSLAGNTFPPACRSRISLNKDEIDHIKEALAAGRRKDYLWHSCSLAIVLMHELAHCLHIGVWGSSNTEEVFIGDEMLSEAGFHLEGVVFGGIAKHVVVDGQGFFTLFHWPSNAHAALYQQSGFSLGRRGGFDGDQHSRVSLLPLSSVFEVLKETFWTNHDGDKSIFSTTTPWWLFRHDEKMQFVPAAVGDARLSEQQREGLEEQLRTQ